MFFLVYRGFFVTLWHVVSVSNIKDESYTYYNIYMLSNGFIFLLEIKEGSRSGG